MITYNLLYTQFVSGENVDETRFYFQNDPAQTEHMLGYLPQFQQPYWIGDCDIPDGTQFKTAAAMFNAPVFDGRSLASRWADVVLIDVGGMPVMDWLAQL